MLRGNPTNENEVDFQGRGQKGKRTIEMKFVISTLINMTDSYNIRLNSHLYDRTWLVSFSSKYEWITFKLFGINWLIAFFFNSSSIR